MPAEKKKRILCVNSEPLHLKLLDDILNAEGYEVLKAEDCKVSLNLLRQHGADLVILDGSQPQLTGLQLCRDIRGNERFRNIPVIMLISLGLTQDRTKAIRAGADDFIIKPFHVGDVASKVRAQLRIQELKETLRIADMAIHTMASFGENALHMAAFEYPDVLAGMDALVRKLFMQRERIGDGPQIILVGMLHNGKRRWFYYEYKARAVKMTLLAVDVGWKLNMPEKEGKSIFGNHADELGRSACLPLIEELKGMNIEILTMAGYMNRDLSVIAMNYGRETTSYDAQLMKGLATQGMILKSAMQRIAASDTNLDHLVRSFMKVTESVEYDDGSCLAGVGECAALLSEQLGMDKTFVNTIRLQAQLYDIGNLQVPSAILKKPDKLSDSEFGEVRNHTIYGARILGQHTGFQMARNIALTHHERWDGSGYPYGMKESTIPIEGRIMNIVDQYHSLRRKKAYRDAFDHDTSCRIILEGDGRTLPQHFDPAVLRVFRAEARRVEKLYEKQSA